MVPSRIPEKPKPHEKSATAQSGGNVAPLRADADTVRDEVLKLPAPWRLHYGDVLPDAHIAFRLIGPKDAPLVAVLGGISAHRGVCGKDGLVARARRPRPRYRHDPLPRAWHRLSRGAGRKLLVRRRDRNSRR